MEIVGRVVLGFPYTFLCRYCIKIRARDRIEQNFQVSASSNRNMIRLVQICASALAFGPLAAEAFAPSATVGSRRAFVARGEVGVISAVVMKASEEKASEEKAAPLVSGEELEVMLTEWDEPLVIDAYATWCGPCLLMAPEFESAAKDLKGKVRLCKLDTDEHPEMAARLNIMGLPTLLFLDKFKPDGDDDEEDGEEAGDGGEAKAVLKDRIEGAIRKDSIIALCEHHFFGGPRPEQL